MQTVAPPTTGAPNDPNDLNDMSFEQVTYRAVWLSGITILLLFLGLGLLGYFFEKEIQDVSQWIYNQFGFSSFVVMQYFADLVLSPIPPDILLIFIAKSDLKNSWFFYVSILGIFSTLAGYSGWWIGKHIASRPWAPKVLQEFSQRYAGIIQKYGPWIVVIGAATPIPFSFTCWSAGFLKMKFLPFSIAVWVRYLRVIAYYQIIQSSSWISTWF